jgi:hypothetical protein
MYGENRENTQVIIDALVTQIKNLKLQILIKDSEIKSLKEKLDVNEKAEKEAING